MINQTVITQRMVVSGSPLQLTLIENPTIDDVIITEAQIQASVISKGGTMDLTRRVGRDVRDFLIRLGVSR
jgi:hypothetical protein